MSVSVSIRAKDPCLFSDGTSRVRLRKNCEVIECPGALGVATSDSELKHVWRILSRHHCPAVIEFDIPRGSV